MKGGNVNEFIDHSTYEEVAVMYNGNKYFFRGLLRDEKIGQYTYEIEFWSDDVTESIYCAAAKTEKECMEKFFNDTIIEGKKFWDIEKDMEWVEW